MKEVKGENRESLRTPGIGHREATDLPSVFLLQPAREVKTSKGGTMSEHFFWILIFAITLALNVVVRRIKKGRGTEAGLGAGYFFREMRIGRKEKREIDAIDDKRRLQTTIRDFIRLEEKVVEAELQDILLRFAAFLSTRGFDIIKVK